MPTLQFNSDLDAKSAANKISSLEMQLHSVVGFYVEYVETRDLIGFLIIDHL